MKTGPSRATRRRRALTEGGRAATGTTLELVGRRRMDIERTPTEDLVRILAPDGAPALTVVVREGEIELRLEAGSIALRSEGDLALEARSISFHGREGVTIESGGDARFAATGSLVQEAARQRIRAHLGDVDVRANDDVKIDGERIRMNC
jgi:hypothetical protein